MMNLPGSLSGINRDSRTDHLNGTESEAGTETTATWLAEYIKE